jgi:hypothetical protein
MKERDIRLTTIVKFGQTARQHKETTKTKRRDHAAGVLAEDRRRAGGVSTDAQSDSTMKVGLLLWEILTVTVVVFGGLCVFLLRSWFSRTDGEVRWGIWLRFSVVLLSVAVLGFVEGVLLSSLGFGWYLLGLVITIYVIARFAPRMLEWER